MCDPSGLFFELIDAAAADQKPQPRVMMGDEVKFASGQKVIARFPVRCRMRLLNEGKTVNEKDGESMEFAVGAPGVYRVEGWLDVGGELRRGLFRTRSMCGRGIATLAFRGVSRNNVAIPERTV